MLLKLLAGTLAWIYPLLKWKLLWEQLILKLCAVREIQCMQQSNIFSAFKIYADQAIYWVTSWISQAFLNPMDANGCKSMQIAEQLTSFDPAGFVFQVSPPNVWTYCLAANSYVRWNAYTAAAWSILLFFICSEVWSIKYNCRLQAGSGTNQQARQIIHLLRLSSWCRLYIRCIYFLTP